MAKRNKFSANDYTYDLGESLMNIRNEGIVKQSEPTKEAIFDLSTLNLGQLLENINTSIKKKPSMFLFFRNRQNEIITIENNKVQLLKQSILGIRELGREMMELRADAFLTNETMDFLIAGKRLEFEHDLELKVDEHKTKLHESLTRRKRIDLELAEKDVDILLKKAELDLNNERVILLRRCSACVDRLSATSLRYVLLSFSNPSLATLGQDAELSEELDKIEVNNKKEDLKSKKLDTRLKRDKYNQIRDQRK